MSKLFLTVALVVMYGCVGGPAAGAAAWKDDSSPVVESGALDAESSVDEVLDVLHRRGEGLRDFEADVSLIEENPDLGRSSTRRGKVWYQDRAEDQARIRVTFDRKQERGVIVEERIEYLLQDEWLVDRDYRRRVEVNRQVLRPGERINLLRLGEGPFPLPIGQPKEEVHRMFEVEKMPVAEGDPDNTVKLRLTPRPGTQFERRFAWIDVWVDVEGHMPVRIETIDPPESSIRTTELQNIEINVGLGDEQFRLPAIDERQWDRHDEPYVE